ncbi:hypothetical protein BGY98DRAFT_37684 [Russula aff. rugulosa BPL654]|nr:hypothetical protein BGY98DRAFT_37684 [Russula aff. rugulosa BPL654]
MELRTRRTRTPSRKCTEEGWTECWCLHVYTIVFLLTGKYVPPTTAAAGEITLRGRVSSVGGMKEKVFGAHRAGWQQRDPTVGESERSGA